MSYNGYPNYDTWLMNLQMEEELQSVVTEMADDKDPLISDGYELGKYLRDYVQDVQYQLYPDMQDRHDVFVDLIRAAFREINWTYLANHYLENVEND